MSTPTTAAPGWYPDRATDGSLRWFDGVEWTHHTAPDPSVQPHAVQAPASQQYPPYAVAPRDDGPGSAIHWMLPVGRSWQSVLAGYLGLFSLAIWLLGPVSIAFGVWALVRANRGGHGRGRAITGIVGGLVGTLVLVAFAASAAGTA
jgi:hypothetical protein